MTKTAFKMGNILLTSKLDLNLKMKPMKHYLWSITLFGLESWTLCKAGQKYSESFDLCCWRRMENIIWTNRVKNTRNITWSQGRKDHHIYNKKEEG
jgi:hypothetical protein